LRTYVHGKFFANKLASLEDENDNAHNWEKLKPIIIDAAKETLQNIEKDKSRNWLDEECKLINERKNRAYMQMVQKHYTRNAEDEYRVNRRQDNRLFKQKKIKHWVEIYRKIAHLKKQKEARKFYNVVNNAKRVLSQNFTLEGTLEDISTTLQDEELEAPSINEVKRAINKPNNN
ncbi:hypothetical protein HHI36_004151, partial [Cryptolaemus montrouzieri]